MFGVFQTILRYANFEHPGHFIITDKRVKNAWKQRRREEERANGKLVFWMQLPGDGNSIDTDALLTVFR